MSVVWFLLGIGIVLYLDTLILRSAGPRPARLTPQDWQKICRKAERWKRCQ